MTRSQLETTTLGEIVACDVRAGAIFDRYGLDYCCGGSRSLADGCRQRGVSIERVVSEIEALDPDQCETATSDAAALIDDIVARHHTYVRVSIPLITAHLDKVVRRHGDRHAELRLIAETFASLADQLRLHMLKEERVLFPYVQALAGAVEHGDVLPPDMFGTVQNPIRMMEIEHQEAGDGMATIRELSRNYEPPADACSTYRLALQELAAFEQDLHQHVHLENNVLFPKAIELESKAKLMVRGLKCEMEGDI